MHNLGLGLSLGLFAALDRNIAVAGTVAGPTSAIAMSLSFNPDQVSGLVIWCELGANARQAAGTGVTLGGTPLASGTTPPVVTLTGTLTLARGLYIKIDGAGARGTATFRWSLDNGATFVATGVLTAATVTLSGAAAAITVNFPVGTYATDNVYEATVAQWNDLSGLGHHLVQATASRQPRFIDADSGINSQPALDADGVNDGMKASAFTWNQPEHIFIVYKHLNGTDIESFDGNTGNSMRMFNNTPTSYDLYAGTDATFGSVTPTNWGYISALINGASTALRENAVTKTLVGNPGAGNGGGLTLFTFGDGTSNPTKARCTAIIGYQGALSTADRNSVEAYLAAKYTL